MQFAVHHRAAGLDISHVEQVVVGAAWKTNPEAFADEGVRTVAAGKVGGLTCVRAAVLASETRAHAV